MGPGVRECPKGPDTSTKLTLLPNTAAMHMAKEVICAAQIRRRISTSMKSWLAIARNWKACETMRKRPISPR